MIEERTYNITHQNFGNKVYNNYDLYNGYGVTNNDYTFVIKNNNEEEVLWYVSKDKRPLSKPDVEFAQRFLLKATTLNDDWSCALCDFLRNMETA
jgi:hypothetical protein